ncbi:hypothetical protein [Flavobacterium psychrotrophum]|uniref:hypothetical protein n=1 Tax=Flavobacterium psychrotrophum TaxID=2294119 RepID=UPI000E32321F|nr:hypothetical protein [Flavobacterium psychrotrophum]
MKILKYVNVFAVGLPFLIALLGIIDNDLWFWAAYSTMLTGLLQVIIALSALIIGHNRKALYIYFTGVISYFFCMFLKIDGCYLYITPVLLAIFLTIIIHKTTSNES